MVRVVDDESRFEGTIDQVWGLIRAHRSDPTSIHPTVSDTVVEQLAERIGVATWSMEFDGARATMRTRVVHFPPLGKLIEWLDGPLAGSTEVTYFTPEGPRTRVSLVGEYRSPSIPEGRLADVIERFHALEFDEDARYLARLVAAGPR
jgi:hypothetical protein